MNRRRTAIVVLGLVLSASGAMGQSVVEKPAGPDAARVQELERKSAELEARLMATEAAARRMREKLEAQGMVEGPDRKKLEEMTARIEQLNAMVAQLSKQAPPRGSGRGPASVLNEPAAARLDESGEPTASGPSSPRAAISDAARLMKEADESMQGIDDQMSAESMAEIIKLRREIHAEGLKRILEQLKAPPLAERPEVDPLAELKRDVQIAGLRREIEKYREVRTELFLTNWIGRIVFVVAHVVLSIGLWMALREFKEARLGRRRAEAQTQEIKLSLEGIALKTALQGVVILAFAMGFYFLYLKFVYPVTTIGG